MEWCISPEPVDYQDALTAMDGRAAAIRDGTAGELVWLLEHPPLFTAGTSAKDADLMPQARFPVHRSGRGGQYTYHGPGQRVAYIQLDLKKRQQEPDIKKYVWQLEELVIRALKSFGIRGERRDGRVGIWVVQADGRDAKIAALGVRIRRWVTLHGISVNIDPDLSHYADIVPCGVRDAGVTSLSALLGQPVSLATFDSMLKNEWPGVFGDI